MREKPATGNKERTQSVRLLAVDLDGTLLNSQLQVSPANRESLLAAAGGGVQIVIVTGRRFHSARPFIEQIPCPVTVISSNGARVGSASGEVHFRNFLPCAVARSVLNIAREYRRYAVAIFDVPGCGQVVMQDGASPEGPLGWYLRTAPDALLQTPDLEASVTMDPVQVMFGGPPSDIEPLEPTLRDSALGPAIHLTWTKYLFRNVSLLDVMNQGCSKGSALKAWAERCGIDSREVMAIGDNCNDLEMLHSAGLPVLMANHTPGLQQNGWSVTLSNDDDGVAAAIQEYILRR